VIVRTVLALVVAAALLAVSLPAITDARLDHTEATVRAEVEGIERAMRSLRATDDPVAGGDGPRRQVTLTVPARSWTDSGVRGLVVRPGNESGLCVRWRLRGGRTGTMRVGSGPVRVAASPLRFAAAGRHRVVVSLTAGPAGPRISVRRFTTEEGAIADHASLAAN
jgi:hypothetical protein